MGRKRSYLSLAGRVVLAGAQPSDSTGFLMPLDFFHPAVRAWFDQSFAAPTPAQADAWPAIKAGRDVLIAAPTGSGKTLAAFLCAIDGLVRQGLDHGLTDETQIVYVSPLKALSNDIHRNLDVPLAGIRKELRARGLPDVNIRSWVRTGDTPQAERQRAAKLPPHIVVTTPESLYILLGSESGRAMLKTTRTVIVDEIHAVASSKRGSHLALSLERLSALCGVPLQRIGLSATQKPIEEVANFLVGAGADRERPLIVDSGHFRSRDLQIEVPPSPLEAVMSAEVWDQVYDRIAELIESTAPRSSSSTRGAWPSGSRASFLTGSERCASLRITAASPRRSGSTPSGA